MLRLFFQLKMMESLQFIATMYDELMASVGTSTANITSAPPIRQEIEAKISSVKAGILANDDIDLLPNLKSTLEQSAPASRIPIPKSDLEVIGGRAAHKLEQIKLGVAAKDINVSGALTDDEKDKVSNQVVPPKEAPKPIAPAPLQPSSNTSIPPSAVESKVYNFEAENSSIRMGRSWWNSDWSFTPDGSGYIMNEWMQAERVSYMKNKGSWETTNNLNSGSDLGIYNNLAYEPFEPIGFTVRKSLNGNVVAKGSSEIEIVSQRHVTGETTVTVSEINPTVPPRILKEFLLTSGSRWGKIGKNSKAVRVDNTAGTESLFYNITFKAFKSDGSPDDQLILKLGTEEFMADYFLHKNWINDLYREEFNIADMSDISFSTDDIITFSHGETKEVNQIYLIAEESGIQITDLTVEDFSDSVVLKWNTNWAVAKVPRYENYKEFMKVSELGCHLVITRNKNSDGFDFMTVRFADKFNDSDRISLGHNYYEFANCRFDDESDWRQNVMLVIPGKYSLTSTHSDLVRSITFVSEKDANEEMIFNAGTSNEFKLKSGESYGDNTTTYAQTITEALRGTALINHLDGRQYKLNCRSILQGPKMNSWTRNPTFDSANVEPPSANEVSYSAMVDYMDAAGVVYGAQVSLFTNDSLSIHNSTNTQHFEGVDPIAIPYKLNDDISCEIRYTTSTGEEKTFSNMKFGLSSTGPSKNDDEHTEDYMFILAPNVIAVNNHSPNATGICEELRDATSVKIFFVNSNANTATDPYAGSNYPSVNVIDMYKISTGATWDPVQPAVGNTDIGSLQLSSARIEYTQHVNNDGEMIVYGIEPTGNEIEMNTYYYKASERQWYAPFLNTYDLTYLTPALTFPIDVIFRDPNYEEASSGSIQFTPENFGQQSYAGTGETAQVLYTVGSPTANTVSHDMHDMELMIAYQYGGQGSNTVTLPLMNPLAALAPQATNTIATFSTDGLVKVNDATPVEYDVQWQAEGLEIKVEQADDGSVKVTYHSAGSPTAAMFSGPALGTFIHEGYQWYVDPATYKSYEFISSDMEMDLYQLTYLPDGELDMNGEASVNFSYQIPRDGFTSMPLAEFNTGNFWFNGEKHNGTEPLNMPLTKQMPADHYSSYVLVDRNNSGPDFLMHPSDTMPVDSLSTVTDITVVTEQNNTHGYTKIKYYKGTSDSIIGLYDQLRNNVIDAHAALENELLSEFIWEWATSTADHNLYVTKGHQIYSHLNEYQTPNLFYYPLNEENYSVNNDATLFLNATNSTLSVTNPAQNFNLDGDQRIYSTMMTFGNGSNTGPLVFYRNPLFGKQIPTGTVAPYNNIQFRLSGVFNQSENLTVYMEFVDPGVIPSGSMHIFATFDRTASNSQFTRGEYSAVPYVMSSDFDTRLPDIKQLTFVDERTGIDAGDFYATHIMLSDGAGQTQIVRAMDSASANALVVPADENISRLIFGGTTAVVFENLGSATYELPKIVNVQPIV